MPALVARAAARRCSASSSASYGTGNPTVADDDGEMTAAERAWGLAPPRDYAAILAERSSRITARGSPHAV